jgi:hypothetical protein
MVAPANKRAKLNRWSFPTVPVLRTAQSFCDSLGGHLIAWVQIGVQVARSRDVNWGVKRCRINGSCES